MKTSLGIWALGTMATRFVPGGYKPELAGETTVERVRRAVEGLGELIDDYEFHYPQELSRRTSTRCATRSTGTASTASRAGSTSTRCSGKGGLCSPDDATREEACGAPSRRPTSPASSARTSSSGRGSRATTTRSRRRTRVVGVARRRDRAGGRSVRGAGRQALPRAQELRAGDEDPDAQHRHDAARDPHAARAGDRQRPGQHGLAAPDHERREPGRVRGAARRRGAARPPARELRLGDVRRRQHGRRDRFMETLELAVELRRAGYGDDGERLGFDLYPYTEDAVGAVRRSVLQWRFIDRSPRGSTTRRCARRSPRRTRCGRTSSSTPRWGANEVELRERLHHVAVVDRRSTGPTRARAFYGELLGREERDGPPKLDPTRIVWYRVGGEQRAPPDAGARRAAADNAALLARCRPVLDDLRARIEAAGIERREADRARRLGRASRAASPYGNLVELRRVADAQ